MNATVPLGIVLGLAAAGIVFWLLSDFILYVYNAGYERGREDAAKWWTQAAKDVEEMRHKIRTEEEL